MLAVFGCLAIFERFDFMLDFVLRPTLIQTWWTLVVTGKDDNVSGFSECEICDVAVSLLTLSACLPTGENALVVLSLRPDTVVDTALVR